MEDIDKEVRDLVESMQCLCGIPGCLGHEDEGGFTLVPKVVCLPDPKSPDEP